jgi:hypothetical protein
MANEFVAKNGIIAKANSTITGTLDVSGNITMGTALVATRTWVTGTALAGYATQSYVTTAINNLIDAAPGTLDTLNELAAALGDDPNFVTTVTNSIATKLSLAGGTMTGNINWGTTDRGLTWSMNTDGAYIKFFNTGDGDTNSRLEYATSDNGNEFHRWMVSTIEEMTLKSDGLRVTDSIWMGGNLVATQSWVNSQNYLTSVPDEYLTETEGNALYAPISHTHSATDIISGTLASARLSGTYAISVSGSAATLTTARTLTIGNTGKNFNGSANVSWSLAEIGALGATAKAADSELLDGIDSSSFLRSNAADTATGEILFDAGFKSDAIPLNGAQNFDNISRSGFYNLYNTNAGSTNSPGFDFGTMLVVGSNKGGTDFGLQLAHERLNTAGGLRVRGMNDTGSAWSAWATVWTSQDFANNSANWNTAYGWGNHATAGYLTSETDSQTLSWEAGSKNLSISNGNTVTLDGLATEEFVTSQGYLTSLPAHNHDDRYYTETESDARYLYYRGYSTSGDTQTFQSTPNTLRFDQVGDLSGAWSNEPTGYYTYGGILSLRGANFALQIYGSHTGDLAFKTQWENDQYSGWRTIITSANIGSQSVAYATSAGNADTVDGFHATNAASGLAYYASNGYLNVPSWINVGTTGIFSGTNNAHLRPNTGSYGAWEMIGSKNGWSGIYFNDSGDYLMANNNEVGHYQNGVGWKFRWYQGEMYISSGTTGGGTERTVIHSGNIGSQSVSYADESGYSGSTGSVEWANVSSRPTALSQFTNDLGNYGGWLTTGGKAADSELIDGIDSSRIVYGDGARASTDSGSMDDPNQKSGFHFAYNPTGRPYEEYWNWITIAGNSWQSSNNYSFQLAHDFHNDAFYVRRMTAGTAYSWREVITTGNISSQSVNYAASAGAVAWTNVSSRPTALSQFTNDLGNYGGWIVQGTQISSGAEWTTATRFGSVGDISQEAGNHALSVRSEDGNDAFMSFHIGSDYAVHFGLDRVSNRMHVGGWSDGTVKYQLWDSRDFTSTNISNWNTAYSWGNHASAGYQAAATAITTSNIGSQSVNYATSAGYSDYIAAQTNPVGNFNVGLTRPKGASYTTTASSVTGAIKIKLPPGVPVHGMWKMTVKIYEYGQRGNGYTIELGCHLYPSTAYNRYQWMLTTDTGGVLPIRYGTDGTSGCVWIGENETTWSYPQIHVTEFSNGFNNPGGVDWTTGTWGVTIGTIDNSVAVDGPYTTSLIVAASATSASYADSIYFNGVQKLYGGSDGTRNTGWAYHTDNGTGIHWPNNGWHIYPINASDMYIRSGASDCSLKFTKNGTSGSYVHCSADNDIGFLTTGRSWSLRVDNSGNAFATSSFRAPIFYDSDTTYYLDPNSTTALRTVGSWRSDSAAWDGEFAGKIQYHSNSWYFQASSYWYFRNASGSNMVSIDSSGNITASGFVGNNPAQTRDKLRVWDDNQYTIGMKNGYDYGHLGNDEYAMSFQMNDDSGRGFWWGDTAHSDDQGAASLTTDGRMTIAKSLSVGEGEAVTLPSSTPLYVKGSTSGADVVGVDGINGRLFTITDDLSNSLFSVNTIAGLPVIEAFADNTVKLGPYSNPITIDSSGKIVSSISNGTILSHGSMVDAIGYNGNYGTYIGSPIGGTYYLYANGTFNENGSIRTLIHSGNIGSQSVSSASTVTHFASRTDGTWYNIIWGAGNPSHLYSSDAVQILSSDGAIRANIYYDNEDTTYYLDPNSTSRSFRGRGEILLGPNTAGEYTRLGGNGGSVDYATLSASNGNLHIDCKDNFGLYLNYYSRDTIYLGQSGAITDDGAYYNGTSAASNSVAWTNVSGRPTAVSSFTNDAGYLTAEADTLGTVTNRGNSTSQNIVFSNGRKGLVGVYDAAQTQAIFAMGIDYILTDGGASSTIGNHYGLAWSYNPDYGGAGNNPQSKAGLNHQLLLMQAGVTTAAMGSGIWTSGLITTTSYGTSANWNTAYSWGNHASAGYQDASTAITTSNIGSQSVNYATSAGSASSSTNLYGGDGSYIQSTSTGTSYQNNYQVRENSGGGGNTNEIYAPQLGFHWSGVVASSIMMEASGRLAIRNNPGTSYESFIAGIIYSSGYGDSTQWNTAYGWGNHASAGYQAAATAITTGNIGSQSVNYATTAGSAPANGGTSTYATYLNPLSGDSNYKLAYTADGARNNAGEWGRAVMYYIPNGQTYGIRVDRADYADSAGTASSASTATTATNATTANRLERYGIIYGDDWNSYNQNNRLLAISAHNHTGSNRPAGAYTYGSGLSYYNGGSDHYQFFFPENGSSSNANSYKIWYRSGWNDSWGGWRSIVDVYNGACAIDGTVTATGDIIAYSDVRVKENIHTIENALDKTLKLRGVTYNRTDVDDKSTKIGVIAQEIMEVLPELVSEDETGMYGVSYGNLTAVLIEAIKEQQKQIEELKLEVQKLKSV